MSLSDESFHFWRTRFLDLMAMGVADSVVLTTPDGDEALAASISINDNLRWSYSLAELLLGVVVRAGIFPSR